MLNDPYFANVQLLMHFDGANDSTTFTDSSSNNHTVNRTGNTKISTTQSKFGGSSGYLDGSGDYLKTASSVDMANSSFTAELWVYPGNLADWNHVVSSYGGVGNWLPQFAIVIKSTAFGFSQYGSFYSDSYTFSTNTWYHLAVCFNGSQTTTFVDGVSVNTRNTSAVSANSAIYVGRQSENSNGAPEFYYTGYVDDLRITKGVVRYTENFTPPIMAFPNNA